MQSEFKPQEDWETCMEARDNPGFFREIETQNGSLTSVSVEKADDQSSVSESKTLPKIKHSNESEETLSKEDEDSKPNKIQKLYDKYYHSFMQYYEPYHKRVCKVIVYLVIFAYGIAASVYWNSTGNSIDWCGGIGLLWILLGIIILNLLHTSAKDLHLYDWLTPAVIKPSEQAWERISNERFFHWIAYLTPLVALIIYLAIDTHGDRLRLISFFGLVVLMLFGYIFSRHRSKIKWRPVVCGLTMQYIFGLITIRWEFGRNILMCLGEKVTVFLAYTNVGSSMVYGEFLIKEKGVFAFQALSTIFFFSFVIQILYYYGIMQWIIINLGKVLQKTMATTACESINTAGSIFIGMTESPLLIKPYITLLTKSELHAVMTGGLATIAGTVMAAYVSFGISPAYLITASLMSAPAALCYAKLFYPETEKTKTSSKDITVCIPEETNVLDAAATGATNAISLILGIIANLIAFVSFVAFLNGVVSWFGSFVGASQLSFEWLLSKIFIPLAWLLGVAPEECENVAILMGLKTMVNEFVAYEKLSTFIKAGKISKRAEMIATYALCGFANPGSVGIMIGGLTAMAPEKRPIITELALRSFIAGSATCFLTACVAGTLIDERLLEGIQSVTPSNYTTFT